MQIITVNMLLHMAANTSWSWGYICSLKTIFCSMHSFGAKCTWTQMFCWKTRSYLSHRSLGLHCHGGGIIWHGINWEQQMRSMMEVFVFLIMLNLKHLKEGEDAVQFANRVRSAIAHQGGLTELPWWVMPSLLNYELFEHAGFSGLLTSWGMLLLRFVLNTIRFTLFFMRKWI